MKQHNQSLIQCRLCGNFVLLLISVIFSMNMIQIASAALSPEIIAASKILRPKPDDEYEYQPVVLVDDPSRKPEIDVEALVATLGVDFLPSFMSVQNPNETISGNSPVIPKMRHRKKHHGNHNGTRESLKTLLGGRMTFVPRGQPEYRQFLKKFLRNHTQCKVTRYWQDLGDHWFPQYVRQAYCTPSTNSCSIPPGMSCHPHRYKEIRMLLWTCTSGIFSQSSHVGQPSVNMDKQLCRWSKRYYKLLDECTCKCKT